VRLGCNLHAPGFDPDEVVATATFLEALGVDSVWTGEAYGSDAVVPLTWVAAHTRRLGLGTAIMQMPGRTPAMTAMTAATLDALSGGRFRLGLGMSGPQVVEGWHGQAYGKPLAKTREYVAILRAIFERKGPLEFAGEQYEVPFRGEGASGLGKPLKAMMHPRADIPIYLAAIGPKSVKLAAEVTDGLLPMFWSPIRWKDVYGDSLAGVDVDRFDIAPAVDVVVNDDLQAARDAVKPHIALYVGGMGARGKNFYNDLVCRYGYEGEARQIQDLFLDGKRAEAAAAVPDALVDEVALVGPKGHIAEQLEAWKACPASTIIVSTPTRDAMELMAELLA